VYAEQHLLASWSTCAVLEHLQTAAQDDTRVVVVDTRDHILSTFDRALSMYADEQFARQGIDVIHQSRVRSWYMLTG